MENKGIKQSGVPVGISVGGEVVCRALDNQGVVASVEIGPDGVMRAECPLKVHCGDQCIFEDHPDDEPPDTDDEG